MYDKYKKTIHKQGLLQRPKLQKWGGLRWFWKRGLHGLWSGLHLQHDTLHEEWVSKMKICQHNLIFKFCIFRDFKTSEKLRKNKRRRKKKKRRKPSSNLEAPRSESQQRLSRKKPSRPRETLDFFTNGWNQKICSAWF